MKKDIYITVDHLVKEIDKNIILNDITLQMEKGKIYGLTGINGSGKTMLLRCICGLVRPTSGKIYINNKLLGKEFDFPESVGALIENPGFIEHYTAIGNLKELAIIRNRIDDSRIKEVLNEVGLDYREKKKVKKYSLGMRQKLGIAIAFMENPDLLILDEPFNALDTDGIQKIKKMIIKSKQRGSVVIICCHDNGILEEISDVIIKLEEGKVINEYRPQGGVL